MTVISFKLAKAGYGTPLEILGWDSETVLGLLEYESFSSDFEEAFFELNKPETQ